jgi:hypothetical protein
MNIFEKIANEQIEEAMKRGDFDNLPGKGKPIDLDEDAGIPEDMRLAMRILKNAGVSPPEVSLRKELEATKAEIAVAKNREKRRELEREAQWICLRIAMLQKEKR